LTPEARKFTVHGRVQGVWFRDSTRREAERLGITGHAINLPDGSVEVLAYGAVDALTELERWLHQGPPLASVLRVETVVVEPVEIDSFRIG
jgi:acylphosphatase